MIGLIKVSPRKNYILNSDDTLRFYKKIKYDEWENHINIKNTDTYEYIINIIKKLLIINKNDRNI